ncbi:pol, partial [Mucuna pruriens]
MEEIHEGTFDTHTIGHALARKILRARYYWTKMESDCCQHIRRCTKCQVYANNIHMASFELHNLVSLWPFTVWGLDMIGPIEPKASNGHRFILRNGQVHQKRHHMPIWPPSHIITDNRTNLNNKMMVELCEQFKIKYHNSTPYRPRMNGVVEVANKNIKKIVQKMEVTYKAWHDMLPYPLHRYRTSTGETPYSLIPSLRVLAEVDLSDVEWAQSWLDQLNLIEEKRLRALCHGQLYQRRIKHTFDRKVRLRWFKEGNLVLRKLLPNDRDPRGNWNPNYEGPYIVKCTFFGGALILVDPKGKNSNMQSTLTRSNCSILESPTREESKGPTLKSLGGRS